MKRLPMCKIREALRLKAAGLARRQIAVSLGVGRTTVGEYLERAKRAGFSWPLPDDLDDAALEQRLFSSVASPPTQARPQPDWAYIHRELRKRPVTLMLLWEEYRAVHMQGYGYSQFCERYRQWKGRLSPTMRQIHTAGERVFVDYAGQTIEIINGPAYGEVGFGSVYAGNFCLHRAAWSPRRLPPSLRCWVTIWAKCYVFLGAGGAD